MVNYYRGGWAAVEAEKQGLGEAELFGGSIICQGGKLMLTLILKRALILSFNFSFAILLQPVIEYNLCDVEF